MEKDQLFILVIAVLLIALFIMLVLYVKDKTNEDTLKLQANLRFGSSDSSKKKKKKKEEKRMAAASNGGGGRYALAPSTSAYMGDYPDESDSKNNRFPMLHQEEGRGETDDLLDVNKLMPSSWRTEDTLACAPGEREDEAEWTRYAPSKESFNKYITSAGSARLGLVTRSAMSRQVGLSNPLRPGVAVPLGAYQSDFLDTDLRQSMIYDATGMYPESTSC